MSDFRQQHTGSESLDFPAPDSHSGPVPGDADLSGLERMAYDYPLLHSQRVAHLSSQLPDPISSLRAANSGAGAAPPPSSSATWPPVNATTAVPGPPASGQSSQKFAASVGDSDLGLNDDREPDSPPKQKHGLLRALLEFVLLLVIAMSLAWALKTFFIEPYEVPTGSMETTIMVGDKLLADKFTVNFKPVSKGDIVVFADKVEPGRILIKRVIATGGQTVDLRDGLVYVNDSPLFEPYTNGSQSLPLTQHYSNTPIEYPFQVPEGHLWVMGDNREHSADSRYFGSVDAETVYGRALLVFWPFDRIGPL